MEAMKKILYTALVMLAVASSLSCTKDFAEMNTNPNASIVASPQSLLAPAIVSTLNTNLNRNFRINNEFMQVTVTTSDSREFHRYEVRPSESEYMWRDWYVQLTNFRDIYRNAAATQQQSYQTFQGISLILDVWASSLLTDMFGDIPYFESNQGNEGNTTPVFDNQQDIYSDFFSKLDSANVLLSGGGDFPADLSGTDPIFNGEALKWRKFGNSLYLRILLRVAHKTDVDAVTKLAEIAENPADYPIMADNSESAILYYTNALPYVNPYYNARDFDFNGDKGYSEFFINNLLSLNDPRIAKWATQATLGVYSGMQSGYAQGSIPEIGSTLQLALKTEPLFGNIMNYAEVQFILAEAALRGYIGLDANELYQKGVTASINLWGYEIDDTYFDNARVDLLATTDVNDQLKKVHLQKYFSLLFTDFQQWYEYRRTGLLDLYKGPGLLNDGKMPVRLNYPVIVQALNTAHYNEAVARLGGDGINEKMWWQP